jgi:hypothetical protein
MASAADRLKLPAWRYLPGINERHADDAFDDVKALCPETANDGNAPDNIAWHYGVRLFNEGYYWEAHEVLEEVWLRALPNSRERFLVQAVIHLANGALKCELGRMKAAERLAAMAEDCLQRAYPRGGRPAMGLEEDALRRNCRMLIEDKQPEPLLLKYEL